MMKADVVGMLRREIVFDDIENEIARQHEKHGANALAKVAQGQQFAITMEEGLEASEALTKYLLNLARGVNDKTELRDELIQLAACAVEMAASLTGYAA